MKAWIKRQIPSLNASDFLPVAIEATKGAIVLGNPSTPQLLVAEFRRADGTFGVVKVYRLASSTGGTECLPKARSQYDIHKQMISFTFQQALIRYVNNDDYQDPMMTTGKMVDEHIIKSRFVPCHLLHFSPSQ